MCCASWSITCDVSSSISPVTLSFSCWKLFLILVSPLFAPGDINICNMSLSSAYELPSVCLFLACSTVSGALYAIFCKASLANLAVLNPVAFSMPSLSLVAAIDIGGVNPLPSGISTRSAAVSMSDSSPRLLACKASIPALAFSCWLKFLAILLALVRVLFCSIPAATEPGDATAPAIGPAITDSSSISCKPSDVPILVGLTLLPICSAFCPASVAISVPIIWLKFLAPIPTLLPNDCLFVLTSCCNDFLVASIPPLPKVLVTALDRPAPPLAGASISK